MDKTQLIEIFTHVRILIAMIISLSIARILSGVATFLQHPKRKRVSVLHLLWVFSILLELILFWWWSVLLAKQVEWTFVAFVFQISYVITLFLMTALLFPDDILEYKGYQDFFIHRRYWFFTLLALTWVIDITRAIVAGGNISPSLLLHASITLFLCVLAAFFKHPNVQIAIVIIYISRQILSI
ncbi:hypothetical protein [Pseudochrobactrum sp. MP213Fo]|uniref:hypothetical protein n=1 Tax=Pseudochrobactrum sp. MP213Fo TaxID=3022250 RepID=UPI003BA190B2